MCMHTNKHVCAFLCISVLMCKCVGKMYQLVGEYKRGCGSVAPPPLWWGEPHDQEVPHAQEKEGAVCLTVSKRHK